MVSCAFCNYTLNDPPEACGWELRFWVEHLCIQKPVCPNCFNKFLDVQGNVYGDGFAVKKDLPIVTIQTVDVIQIDGKRGLVIASKTEPELIGTVVEFEVDADGGTWLRVPTNYSRKTPEKPTPDDEEIPF